MLVNPSKATAMGSTLLASLRPGAVVTLHNLPHNESTQEQVKSSLGVW